MKKRLLLACFLALPLYIVAQTSFGIKAGPNYTAVRDHISPSNAPEMAATEGILGFHGGIFRQKSISDALYLQFEFLYNIKGSKVTFANTASNQRFHYLSL
ncbi:MAG: hypothetical protein SFU99_01160, partial [Saprospiraceae bacterium]|nr:hypothetical protein [Saprospiraceae bacterium]